MVNGLRYVGYCDWSMAMDRSRGKRQGSPELPLNVFAKKDNKKRQSNVVASRLLESVASVN